MKWKKAKARKRDGMTFTVISESVNGIYIEITQDKFESVYRVSAYEIRKDGTCGYPLTSLAYADLAKAKKRFSALKHKAKEG